MDSSTNNSRNDAMDTEYDRAASVSTSTTSPATTETATTISTIILQSHPIQIVVGLLQTKNSMYVKVVEITPKLNFLGANIDETVEMQRDHEIVHRKLQTQRTPIDEFVVKAEKLIADKKANPKLLEAMEQSLNIAWQDLLRIFEQRRHVLNINANFHEKIAICLGKMSSLEVACRDTMLPNEIDAIQDFLNKFKQLRIDVLASVMVTLKEGNELLAALRETAMGGQCDSRPDSIKVEIKKSMALVELWLEQLHDRRNDLEQAWQSRKTQLEQCLAFAMLIRDINELQKQTRNLREIYDNRKHQLDSEVSASNAHAEVVAWKNEAIVIRDRALKITRSTEKLSNVCRFDNNSNNTAYMFLNECTELVEELDNYEELLSKISLFFEKAEKSLTSLRQLESESSHLIKERLLEKCTLTRLINDTSALVEEPLRLGYALLDRIGRSNPEAFGVEKTIVEIENRRIYLEELYSQYNLDYIKITQTLNEFYETCNSISAWLVSVNKAFLSSNNSMGKTLHDGTLFLQLNHQMLSDLEIKGTQINRLLSDTSQILEAIDKDERDEVDKRVQALRDSWDVIKTIVENRVDLSTNFIKFLQLAEKLAEMFKCVEQILQSSPEQSKLSQMDELWAKICTAYTQLKEDGNSFVEHISMVVDDTLERQTTRKCVEQILTDFSLRQLGITESWEKWTTIIRERREIEEILQKIMSKNELSLISASKLDAQLYPILIKQTTDLTTLKSFLHDKLHLFLADIEKAQIEITHHIQTTAALQPKDDKTIDKVTQVLRNLNAIVNKLASIKNDFQNLIDGIVDFIESLITAKNSLELYFKQASLASDSKNIDTKITENEQFSNKFQSELRILFEQRDRLIAQINKQEPFETKDHDINVVNSLLDIVKDEFDTKNSALIENLRSEGDVERFKTNFKSIFEEIDRLKNQLNNSEEQLKQTLLTSNTNYISYKSYEQVIQVLDQRIDKFINTSENVCNNNSNAKPFIQNSISELKRYWNDLKRQANELERNIENMKQYFTVNEQIDCLHREHREYLQTIINATVFAKSSNETNELINKIDRYISDHESRQLELLKDLATLSKMVYGFDKTIEKYSENIELFQSFFSTKNQLNSLGEQLVEEERLKVAAAEEYRRNQEIQKQQQQQQQQIKPIETSDEVVDFVSKQLHQTLQQQQHQQQLLDVKVTETRQVLLLEEAPRFIRHLCDVTVQEGERCHFMCQLQKFSPSTIIEWFKDGDPITNQSNYVIRNENGLCTLAIERTVGGDSAIFSCRAKNHMGSHETTAKLIIQPNEQVEMLYPPNFVNPLTNCKTSAGSSLMWRCFVGGTPLPTVQWFKNDICIDVSPRYNISYNNGEAILRIDDLTIDDAGTYTAIAKNILGVDQCSAILTVTTDSVVKNAESDSILQSHQQQIHHVRPEFRTPLRNLTASVGQPIVMECELVGEPKPNIYWKFNGKPLLISDRMKLQHDFDRVKLLISEAQSKDVGTYTLCAKNIAGIAYTSCDVHLEMTMETETLKKPTVLLPLKDVRAIEGKSVQLQCEISGLPEPEVIWYHENKPVKESSDVQLLFRGDRCSLFIQEAYLEDMGVYKVVAINSAGEASSTCKLTIESLNETDPAKRSAANAITNICDGFAPRFEHLLCDILANEGETIHLECMVVGQPKPTIKWFLSNNEIIETDRIQFAYSPDDGKAKLILKNVSIDDKGVYTVQAINSLGEAKCFSHLIVKSINTSESLLDKQVKSEELHHFLDFKEKFTDKHASIGDSVKFECIVAGKPKPKIRWLFNDRPVQGSNFLPSTSGDRQVLTIPAISNETIGKISCAAENDFHREMCSAYLTLVPDSTPLSTKLTPLSSQQTELYTQEYDTSCSNVTIKKQSTISTHTSQITSFQNGAPTVTITADASIGQIEKPINIDANGITELKKSTISQTKLVQPGENLFPKTAKRETAPRFISPFIGKIIEQGCNMILEAVIDGFPAPNIELTKNGVPLCEKENVTISCKNNRIIITLQNVTTADAGRYSCSLTNPIGNALNTADVVVKKTIFPPVFGHRLQAKVAKNGDRVLMDIEVSGTPQPNITWYKDGKPLDDANISAHKIISSGNCHTLIFEKVCKQDSGTYMCKAVNDAGETQSIADFIILEPTPEQMTDIVKTVAVENVDEHRNQFNTSVCSNVSFTTMENQVNDEYRSSSVRFKESDSGRDSNQKIHPLWRPGCESDAESPRYRSIKPILTPTMGRSSVGPSPISPSAFEKPQRFTSTSEQFTRDVQVLKPKPVSARYQSKPFASDLVKSTQFYTATTGTPYHNQKNVAAESSSTMEIREATESTQRIVNMSSTRKIITYDQQQQQQQQQHSQSTVEKSFEPFPFTVSPTPSRQKYRPPPTPTKFVPGEFRESDYDSEIESMKIRPLWTPNPIELENLHYRHVSPPTPGRSSSVPKHYFERILTPMEFDVNTVEMPSQIKIHPSSPNYSSQQQNQFKTQTLDRFRSKKKSSTNLGTSSQDDINITHSTPKYSRMRSPSQSYHEECRASQYGTKCVDEDTGLIYFKYDFGYEFGILFPGEGRKYIGGGNSKYSQPIAKQFLHNSAGAIDIPVTHENTIKYNMWRQGNKNNIQDIMRTKNRRKLLGKNQQTVSFNIDELHSPGIKHHLPRKEMVKEQRVYTPIETNYTIVGASQHDQVKLPKYAPLFVAPLRNIAVLSGHTARFECIVQCEPPHPCVEWYRNDVPIQNGKYFIEFRNGVCRLTIPETVPSDSGLYQAKATNAVGSVVTSAELLVNNEIWGIRK
ncbi:uncharacterized protein LOC116338440 isoform X3 [Contarinia nasturtii]|uniref:uncharacterized protein LOC116338440 isoform X3 n=1 Tax=Contarinia nasturtii TaxID=265458 RepID=UPI0012D39122|nr:uncharacterized protein LOC116338440 isoform X3 [Contarinia nasturtii]